MNNSVINNQSIDTPNYVETSINNNGCVLSNTLSKDSQINKDDYDALLEKLDQAFFIAHKRKKKIRRLEQLVHELQSQKAKQFELPIDEQKTDNLDGGSRLITKNFNFKIFAFLLLIIMPSFLVLLYTVFMYDSMYISSSSFTIKSNVNENVSEFSSKFGFLGSSDNKELYTASAYVLSLDMFYLLENKLGLIEHFSAHDIVSSLPKNPTQSDIEDYWRNVVEVRVDTESELMQLQVRAYSPEFSQKLSQGILDELETFINNMNDKIIQDSIRLASLEVDKAKQDIESISDRIRRFRDKNTFIDPSSEASNLLSIINNLENLITQSKADLAQKRAYLREDSVDIVSLKNKISSLEQEVISLRSRIAQNKGVTLDTKRDSSLANVLTRTMSEFEQLNLEYQFAQKVLEAALNNLETTRQHSLSKSKYLVTIDNPKIPDESLWPRPFLATIVTFIVTIFLLSAISLLISAIKEHLGI